MELRKSTKIYQRIKEIAKNCEEKKDFVRADNFNDFAEQFRLVFIQPKLESK